MATSRYGYCPLWLLPVMATARYGYFPLWLLPVMATSRYGYFPLWLLPVMATSRYGYCPLWLLGAVATWRYGYFPLWLLPVIATSRYGYCPPAPCSVCSVLRAPCSVLSVGDVLQVIWDDRLLLRLLQGDSRLWDGDAGSRQRLPPRVLRLPTVQPQVRGAGRGGGGEGQGEGRGGAGWFSNNRQLIIEIRLFPPTVLKLVIVRNALRIRWYRDTSTSYNMYDSVLVIHNIMFRN